MTATTARTRRLTPTQQLVAYVDRVVTVTVEDSERRLFIEANMDPAYARPPRPFTVEGIVLAVDADDTLPDGGSVILRDLDDGYRIIALADVVHVRPVKP